MFYKNYKESEIGFIMKENTSQSELLFEGSVWCNLDVALRQLDQYFRHWIKPKGLAVIEWYILRALYEKDGQHASELARAVGRAATSFTPNLDKLQDKGYIERQPDKLDRRAVRIFLTDKGHAQREAVLQSAQQIDAKIRELFSESDFNTFLCVLNGLQQLGAPEEPIF
ncbi:MAG: hypothetical protein CUN56_02630 [Phototrophicales bacterium]|nr:MAG: hypothetical protein CUN56_02630 [Phototrophicales bacterium]RMG75838.1 MAG: MarR family transcriptional regulator [Chloroflexota bacterium]